MIANGDASLGLAEENFLRQLEALLFAAREPVTEDMLQSQLPAGADLQRLLARCRERYGQGGIVLQHFGGRWMLTTAPDLAALFSDQVEPVRKLSRAALETLTIIACHQPVTRTEIEDIRGVTLAFSTLALLTEAGWVRIAGRRRSPGNPAVYVTTDEFLIHFGLTSIEDLPGLQALRASGLLAPLPPLDVLVFARDDIEPVEPEGDAE